MTTAAREPHELELTIAADDGLPLAGTLTLPTGAGPHPAVLFLPGSGRVDRNADAGRLRVQIGQPLAAAMAQRGIATLRYDRRGVAATPGDWRAAGFLENRADAVAALRGLAARPDIRSDAIGVVGHSEGALHAMWLGAHMPLAAVVMLAGFARSGEDAVRWQLRMMARELPPPISWFRPLLRRFVLRGLERIKTGRADVMRIGGAPINARWYREMLAHDTRSDLRQVRTPVLAITGEKDIQVDPADLEVIAQLVSGDVQTHRIPDLTHPLRRDSGPASLRAYRRLLRQPVDPELLDLVADWLAGRFLAPGPIESSRWQEKSIPQSRG